MKRGGWRNGGDKGIKEWKIVNLEDQTKEKVKFIRDHKKWRFYVNTLILQYCDAHHAAVVTERTDGHSM